MPAYYNEHDTYAAQWLRSLISAGHIAAGEVDERSIEDVRPRDLDGFTQCHFFAGIGVWSYALRLAGWPDDRPVWTGSCPCQPFSTAGQGVGFADERHLWPAWHHLIKECRPAVVFGEQVASADGLEWLDLVSADMEATGYAFGAADLCAAGVGAPHIRQRLWFVAHTNELTRGQGCAIHGGRHSRGDAQPRPGPGDSSVLGWMANDDSNGRQPRREGGEAVGHGQASGADRGAVLLGNAGNARLQERIRQQGVSCEPSGAGERQAVERTSIHAVAGAGPTNGLWRDADWLACRDGKWRPVEPSTFPLAHGAPTRVGRLRAYGNAINAEAARIFIESAIESLT